MRPLLQASIVVAISALVAASAGVAGQPVTQTLNPPPPSYYTCMAVGQGTICEGNPPVDSFGPIDTAVEGIPIVCGSGASAFDVYDTATDVVTARRVYDADGNLVRRVLRDDYTFGEFSNPLNGATVPYTQTDIRTDVLAVPGDLGSATETTTWNIRYHATGDGAPVLMNTGRTVQAPDGTLESRAGRLEFFDIFGGGQTSLLAPLCAALRLMDGARPAAERTLDVRRLRARPHEHPVRVDDLRVVVRFVSRGGADHHGAHDGRHEAPALVPHLLDGERARSERREQVAVAIAPARKCMPRAV